MPRWIVSVPCWGKPAVDFFKGVTLPHLKAALEGLPFQGELLVHTDENEEMAKLLNGVNHRLLPVKHDPHSKYTTLALCHQEALEIAEDRDIVTLLCSDMIVSKEFFQSMAETLMSGKKIIFAAAHRTLPQEFPEVGTPAVELNKWAMKNAHSMIKRLVWGEANLIVPWCIYFKKGESVCMRGFNLHPIAVVKDRPLTFNGQIDWDLICCYEAADTHIVTRADELAVAEVSPAYLSHNLQKLEVWTPERIARWAMFRTLPPHRWSFQHRIHIVGDEDCGDQEVCDAIMEELVKSDAIKEQLRIDAQKLLEKALTKNYSQVIIIGFEGLGTEITGSTIVDHEIASAALTLLQHNLEGFK